MLFGLNRYCLKLHYWFAGDGYGDDDDDDDDDGDGDGEYLGDTWSTYYFISEVKQKNTWYVVVFNCYIMLGKGHLLLSTVEFLIYSWRLLS